MIVEDLGVPCWFRCKLIALQTNLKDLPNLWKVGKYYQLVKFQTSDSEKSSVFLYLRLLGPFESSKYGLSCSLCNDSTLN